jgi:hypothetical protein
MRHAARQARRNSTPSLATFILDSPETARRSGSDLEHPELVARGPEEQVEVTSAIAT